MIKFLDIYNQDKNLHPLMKFKLSLLIFRIQLYSSNFCDYENNPQILKILNPD